MKIPHRYRVARLFGIVFALLPGAAVVSVMGQD